MNEALKSRFDTLTEDDWHVTYRILEKWMYDRTVGLDGGTKAAVVLQSLNQSARQLIISWFDLYENGVLNEKLDDLADIDATSRERIVEEFFAELDSFKNSDSYKSQAFLEKQEIDSSHVGFDKSIEERIVELIPFQFLERFSDILAIQKALHDECPETIAYVVYHLHGDKRDKLLALFSHERKDQIRHALLTPSIQIAKAFEIDRALQEKLKKGKIK